MMQYKISVNYIYILSHTFGTERAHKGYEHLSLRICGLYFELLIK